VGAAAQAKAMRSVAGRLRLELAQCRELAIFSQFASDMDRGTRDLLAYGEQLSEMLRQDNNAPLPMEIQVCLLYAVVHRLPPRDLPMDRFQRMKREFPALLRERYPGLLHALRGKAEFDGETETAVRQAFSAWITASGAETAGRRL
jgi:F-type H+-transporting ATPase subunit alpha